MKKTVYHSKSIRNRILIFTLSAILGMCLLISLFSYYIFRHYLQNTLIQSTETSLRLLSESMDNSIDEVYRLVRYCQTDSNIANYIEHNPNPGSVLSVSTYDSFYEECSRNSSYNYMPRIAIVSQEHYLQVVTATYSSTADLATLIPELPYYEELLTADDYDFSPGIVSDPFHRAGRKVLPVIRPITYQYNNRQAGYLFIEISADLFTIPLKDYSCPSDSFLYLSIAGHTYIYENGGLQEFTPEYSILDDLSTYSLTGTTQISKIHSATMGEQILVTTPLDMPDCYLSQSISHAERTNQAVLFMGILACILIGILSIGILLMILMNRMITVPVSKLQTRMVRIAGGDFSRDPSVEWEHELGDIGRGINDLSENVSELMEKRLEDEKQKQDLEYKMLQSQINPHFLYNTLNSIKWMATIQGATGISEMTTSLSRLLKSISKGTSLLIDIREELSLLENYFTIQSYRYGGTITMDIQVDNESLYNSEIIKFTLQPLVENAIFHGIEPKGCAGHIRIHVGYETSDNTEKIRIDVTDDGVGMTADKAAQVLRSNDDSSADFFREIGVSNVHKRLQYQFGAEYGITIESKEGEYTTMSIHIPNIPLHNNETVSSETISSENT